MSTSAVTAFASEQQEWLKKGGVRRPMVDPPFGLLTPDEPQSFLQRQQGLTGVGARVIVALLRQQYAILGFVSAQSVSVIANFAVWRCATRQEQSSAFMADNHHESPSLRSSVFRPYHLETLPQSTRHPAFPRTLSRPGLQHSMQSMPRPQEAKGGVHSWKSSHFYRR